MQEIKVDFKGGSEITITLEKGETYPAIGSTKKEFYGPGIIKFTHYDVGHTILHCDYTTAHLRYKASSR